MLNRIFVREKCDEEYSTVKNRFKIGVLGMGSAVGTSFVATAVAKELSKDKEKHVAYVEINRDSKKPFLYDSVGMDKRFAGRIFFDFHEEISRGRSIAGIVNPDERINWAVRVPNSIKEEQADNENRQKKQELDLMEACRLINNITADTVVCDITYDEEVKELVKELDVLIFVIDPLPSKIINNYDLLCEIKRHQLLGGKVLWVVNKHNEGINKREFSAFIKIKQFTEIPMVSANDIYAAEYNCSLPYSVKNIYEATNMAVKKIVHAAIT